MISRVSRLFVASVLWCTSVIAQAQLLEMNNAPLTEFVNWYSQLSGKGVVLPPNFDGRITLYNANIDGDNIDTFFVSVMASRGYEVIPGSPLIIKANPSIDIQQSRTMHSQLDGNEDENALEEDEARFIPRDNAYRDDGSSFDSLLDYPQQQPPKFLELETRAFKFQRITAKSAFPVVDIFLKSLPTSGSSVVLDAASNSLIVTTVKGNFDNIAAFIHDIDVKTEQVLIEAIMFEVGKGSSFDFSFAAGKRSDSTVVGGINTTSLSDSLTSKGAAFGIFSGNILSLALTAVEGAQDSKILSVPRILTLSGSEGFISSGQNVPIVTGKLVGEGVDAKNPFQTITRRDVGINLRVTPIVLGDGSIMLDLSSNSGSISNVTAASDIILNERTIKTTVQLNDGDTLLIGGLIQHNAINQQDSTPVVSSIPLIGWLFESTSESESQSTMYILIRARTVSPR
ncbi:type II/III secretion system protein [Providencia alcalifaciens]|uniref:General secretion pathway protein GspD n=1 Tax=Providencia alcalifaciens TaxID=126385 RepID=A0AAW9V6R2_9GAMM|nr:type II/III secretion system protein [Providencia alcalifaciens]EKT66530.1 Bacterial type II and III secretion system protein [Providencia alcalifaciens Dmel2]MTC33339.1 general secretion pathway protein GspD [Providencia alcalifaciens]